MSSKVPLLFFVFLSSIVATILSQQKLHKKLQFLDSSFIELLNHLLQFRIDFLDIMWKK